jgi:hypothetical protein
MSIARVDPGIEKRKFCAFAGRDSGARATWLERTNNDRKSEIRFGYGKFNRAEFLCAKFLTLVQSVGLSIARNAPVSRYASVTV